MTLRQETDFPAEKTTVLTIGTQSPVETTVYLRYPSWSKEVKVAVNGKKVAVKQKPGSILLSLVYGKTVTVLRLIIPCVSVWKRPG